MRTIMNLCQNTSEAILEVSERGHKLSVLFLLIYAL